MPISRWDNSQSAIYVLYQLSPQAMKEDDLEYGQATRWMSRHAVLERVTRYYPQDNDQQCLQGTHHLCPQ